MSVNNRHSLKNIVRGMGSIFNIYPRTNYYQNKLQNSCQSDAEALRQDWFNVGQDLKMAINKLTNNKLTNGKKPR